MSAGQWMSREIAEQPARWADLLHTRDDIDAAARLLVDTDPELIVLAARGSSDHAAMFAQYLIHSRLGIPAMLATPASVTAHGAFLRYPRSVALAVSQSGRSPDLLATVDAIRRAGVPMIAFANDADSELAAAGDVFVNLTAGDEVAVAATKTYTAELLALWLTVQRAAGRSWPELEVEAEGLSRVVAAGLRATGHIEAATAVLAGRDRVMVVGRGLSMSSAKEGALKLMETNAIAASGWSAADAIHGPLGQVVPGTVVILLTASSAGRDSVLDFGDRAAALGASIVEIGPGLIADADAQIPVGEVADDVVPLAEIVPLQRLALALAVGSGLDPDNPAGLRKVTLTT
ncbi:hypothetical protein NS183_11655 [Microbacterium testaceum]|uniref:SIS domain-containing protein n=1 Tax=Microbacterium testaceum TaxID=2033 RepID=UPI0007346E10|nr:SIS domain-containing protein [Microbacterium testaceum]KTS85997.1 hypothetical protein NS183_11655 [Microbacterium testaceum]